jgi:ribosome-associated translation inhibitor RaiA
MQTQAKQTDTEIRDREMDEELTDVLTAISVVSKRLARKLSKLSQQEKEETEGGKTDEQDE